MLNVKESHRLVQLGQRQFTLRRLLGWILAVCAALAVLREASPEWLILCPLIAFVVMMCRALSLGLGMRVQRLTPMLTAVSIPSLWLLWLGLDPSFYYMTDVAFLVPYWGGVALLYALGVVSIPTIVRRQCKAQPRWWPQPDRLFFLLPVIVTLLIVTHVPLRLGFLTAWPRLAVLGQAGRPDGALGEHDLQDEECGLYTISLAWTRGCHIPGRIVFVLADDLESGFIYSPNGIEDLCYNSGNSGHLIGNWYWMKED